MFKNSGSKTIKPEFFINLYSSFMKLEAQALKIGRYRYTLASEGEAFSHAA
jgi:hypothetical protein